jgi:hypothetical protein
MPAGDRNVILAEFTPYDPVSGAAVTMRACSVDDARVTSLNGVAWWPAISQAPRRTIDLFDGEFGGRIGAAIGDIEIATAAFPNAPRYSWGEQPVKLWRGVLGAAWGSYTQIFQGLTRPARGSNGRLRIGLRVDDRWMDRPLLSTYAGTGGVEGPADLKGVPKPLALGAPQFCEGVLINRALNIYQLHGYGGMAGVTAALDRLNRFGAAAGNDANYTALAAASIVPGAWRTCLAEGLVRFGAPPAGVASFLLQGDNGSGLGWVRTPGQVIRRLALIAGATDPQINAASLAALDSAVPFNISLHIRDQTTARDVIQSIAASCNASAGVSHLGTLFVARAVIGTPVLTLRSDGAALPPVASVELLETSAPFWRIALDSVRTERVHSAGEFAALGAGDIAYADGTLLEALKPGDSAATRNVGRGTYAAGATYAYGDEVIFSGSSYRLIIATSTGNAPPDAARWQLFAAAGSGPPGADGSEGITITATNQAHSVPTEADGSGGSYGSAGGTMILRRGATLLSPVFSVAAQSPNTGWASIDSGTGVYTITDPGATLGTATLRAAVGGVNYDVTYTISKTLRGVAGPNLTLVSDAQAFTFVDGAATPGSQTITLNALLTNLSGTATWTATPAVTLGGSGNTRTLAIADFGTNRQVTIEATLSGITDRITLVRLERNIVAANAANRVPFSRIENDKGWAAFSNSPSGATPAYFTTDSYKAFYGGATATAVGQFVRLSPLPEDVPIFRVAGGERLSVSARISGVNISHWTLNLDYSREDGSRAEVNIIPTGTTFSWTTQRTEIFFDVPSDARVATINLYGFAAATGAYGVLISEPMVTGAVAGQTVHPAFSAGPNASDGADVTGQNTALNTQNVASQTATALVAQAATAASDSASALSQISTIVSDSVLDRSEKPQVYQRWLSLQTERATINTRATAFGITTELTNYTAANTALDAYLGGLSPAWNSYTTDTPIVRSTFEGRFTDVYFARQVLLDAIARVASERATWANVSGNGRPEDGATLGSNKVSNAGLIGGTQEWVLNAGITRVAALASDPGNYLSFATGATRFAQTNGGAARRIDGGPLFWQAWTYIVSTSTTSMTALFNWFRADGSAASTALTSINIAPAVAGFWVQNRGKITPPADAVSFRLDFGVTAVGGVALVAGAAVANSEAGADITTAQPIVSRLSSATGQALENFVLATGLPPSQIVGRGEVRDGQTVVFSPPLARPPEIVFLPGGNTGVAGQNNLIAAVGLTASGFVARAVTQAVTPGTTITDTGATSGGGGDPDLVMNRSSGSAPFDGQFTFKFAVNVGEIAPGEPGFVRVGLFVRQSGAWVQVGFVSRSATGEVVVSVSPASVDFGAGNEFGIDLLAAEGAGSGIAEFTSVAYTPGTVTETSLTPAGASAIPFLVVV